MKKIRTSLFLVPALAAAFTPAAPAAAGSSPQNIAAPAISGTAQAGKALAAQPGGWSGSGVHYSYQWQHCSEPGYDYANATGALAPGGYSTYLAFDIDDADAHAYGL